MEGVGTAASKQAQQCALHGASKAMLISITELVPVGLGLYIRVNAVAAAHPHKRRGEPDDIGGVVAFLLSGDAARLSDQTVVINGGVMLTGGVE